MQYKDPRREDDPSAAPAAAPHQAPLRVTFLVLLIGIGPKIALVVLMVLGELLRALLHFTIGSLSISSTKTACW